MLFFGNDFDKPLAIGKQDENRYGALQTSCVYCAECDVGCNTHSKNTLDLNYLHVAETRHNVQIKTEVLAEKIVPLNEQGKEDSNASGEFGYRVFWLDLLNNKEKLNNEFGVVILDPENSLIEIERRLLSSKITNI